MDARSSPPKTPKILMTKIGLDGHDRGSPVVATYLRDAGMEVVCTGPWQAVETAVTLAIEEDVDLIGISSLATDHLLIPRLMTALEGAGLGHLPVVVGGIVPDHEEADLLEAGVARVFHPGAARDDIIDGIRELALGGPETTALG